MAGASARVTPPRVQGTAPRAGKQLWGLATGCGETSPPRRVGLRCKGFARGKAAKGQPDWALFPSGSPRSARWPWARLPLPPTPSAPKAGPSWRRLLRGRWSLAIIFYRLVAGASARVTPPRVQGTAPRAGKQLWGLATGCGETSPPRRVGLRCKGFARGKAAKGQPDWALFPSGCRAFARLNIQYSVLFYPIYFIYPIPIVL